MKILTYIWLLTLLLLSKEAITQISASSIEGCAPLTGVVFSSSFNNPTNINWNFGDGASSNLPSPSHNYSSPGTFNVSYSATVGGSTVTDNLTIIVHDIPEVNFSLDGIDHGCVGTQTSFSDNSTGGDGSSVIGWQWAFGDGGVNTNNQNPIYTYNVAGIFDVSLIVTDQNGCVNSGTLENLITISGVPEVDIITNPSPPSACNPPLNVTFTSEASSNSPLTNALTYSWTFPNDQTSSAANPGQINFTEAGFFIISLTVEDDNECANTVTQNVSINNPIADIAAIGGENDTVCKFVTFVNNSTGINPMIQYGDGDVDNELFHEYPGEGWYDVTLTVNSGQCIADTTISIYVQIPTVEIIVPQDLVCGSPFEVTASAESDYDIETYNWISPNFNLYNTPTFTETIFYSESEYSINYTQTPDFQLTIVTTDGCTATAFASTNIYEPNALFFPFEDEGCAPLTTTFVDYSATAGSEIIEWTWHFDDGSPNQVNTLNSDVTHTYNEVGIYNPYLVIVLENGCRDTSWAQTIFVGSPPNTSFEINNNNVCIGDPIKITDTTPIEDNVDTWHYNADLNTHFSCQNEPNTTLIFDDEVGNVTIELTAGFRGCYTTSSQTVNVGGPIGKLKYECNCETPLNYPFHVEASEATSWSVDFGDGTIIENTTSTNFDHNYPESGDYWAVLTLSNANTGCPDYVDSVLIKARQIDMVISLPDSLCLGVQYAFDAMNSQDVAAFESVCYNSMIWYFGNDTQPKAHQGSYQYSYNEPGTYNVQLWGEDINGCVDSTSKTVQVFGITADALVSYDDICVPFDFNATSTSTSDLEIVDYTWSDVNGIIGNESSLNYTFLNPNYSITNVLQPFQVILSIVDEAGCTATDTTFITPSVPNANFSFITPNVICEGQTVTYDPAVPQGSNQFAWIFENVGTSNAYNPVVTFENPGTYDITLQVTNSIGCTTTKTIENYANVQAYPNAGFISSALDGDVLCYPVQITFTDTTAFSPFGSRTWNLGNGQPTVGTSTIGTNYDQPGEYTISMTVQTTAGCASTAEMDITVEGPVGNFTLLPSTICRGETINLAITDTTDVMTWQWDFGDGTVSSEVNPVAHEYDFDFNPAGGQTLISLVMWNQDSICNAVATETVNFVNLFADFYRNNESLPIDTAHCFGIADIFSNQSSANADVFDWNFGNGQTFSGSTPPAVNYQPGTYTVSLAVQAIPEGCVDTIAKQIVVFPLPQPNALGGEICLGESLQLNANGGESFIWTPDEFLDNPNVANPTAFPDVTTEFTVSVTDENGCENETSATVVVYQPLIPQEEIYTIIIGEEVELNVFAGNGYSYEWTPDIWISCTDCPNPIFQPLADTTYFVTISDDLGCFDIVSRYEFIVLPLSSIDVPDVFTPNGDGVNDIIYVRGWGIEEIEYFRIYNRWGELVFETNDPEIGWDGKYKGVLQQADTYAYVVVAKAYIFNEPITKEGFINIIR